MIPSRYESTRKKLSRSLNSDYEWVPSQMLEILKKQLNEYFNRERREFNLPLLFGGTDFQKNVWEELCRIPYGKTVTYSQIAERTGHPAAVRGIGGAVGANPISIIVPCHRVVGKEGSLTGYAGGLDIKSFLLDLERNGQF